MYRKISYLGSVIVLASIVICMILFTDCSYTATKKVKEKITPRAYIKEDQSTAVYIDGNSKPILRIEDLPKEFPPHIHHPEGARFPDTRFNLASLSPDGKKIVFSCGLVHNWVGLFGLKSKKIDVISWLFDSDIDQILWSPNSRHFAYTFVAPSGEFVVETVSLRQKTQEPYISNWWGAIKDGGFRWDENINIYDFQWSEDGESIQFTAQKSEIKDNKEVRMESEPEKIITLRAIKEETVKETPKKEKVKKP
ncbi:MAG TPA: hypothetical protein VGB16_00450 [candidate division Zixibacteria bacterium]